MSTTISAAIAAHLATLEASGYATSTVASRRAHLVRFSEWSEARGLTTLDELTPPVLERYRHCPTGRRTPSGAPLSWSTHANILTAVRMLLAWATRTKRLVVNPAAELERPRLPKRLPRAVLSVSESSACSPSRT